jgi:ABC-type transport system involved in multi-copper enzyme maturation permease subunit
VLQRIVTVALNAYREAVRARILLGLAGVASAVAFYSLIVGAFTLRDAARVVADLGAAAISIFSIAVAVLIGAQSLYRELEMKTILPLLARPIRRSEYLVGKYVGTMLVITVFILAEGGLVLMMAALMSDAPPTQVVATMAIITAIWIAAMIRSPLARTYGPIPWSVAMFAAGLVLCATAPLERSLVVGSVALTWLEVSIIAAIATLFSSFSTPFLSSLLTVGTLLVGRNADALARLPAKVFGDEGRAFGKALSAVVPNMHVYVPARPLLTGEAVDANLPLYVGYAAVQSLGWTLGLLTLAAIVFHRRDFV